MNEEKKQSPQDILKLPQDINGTNIIPRRVISIFHLKQCPKSCRVHHSYCSQSSSHPYRIASQSTKFKIKEQPVPCSHLNHSNPFLLYPTVTYLLKWTADTGSECAGNVFRHFPVLTSQIRTDSSKEPKQVLLSAAHNHYLIKAAKSIMNSIIS